MENRETDIKVPFISKIAYGMGDEIGRAHV